MSRAGKRARRRLTRSCTSKVRYESWSRAHAVVHTFLVTVHDTTIRPYSCRNCGGWHVGHKAKRAA